MEKKVERHTVGCIVAASAADALQKIAEQLGEFAPEVEYETPHIPFDTRDGVPVPVAVFYGISFRSRIPVIILAETRHA